MKQSDIFSIIIIGTVGTLAAYFAVNALLGDPNLQSVTIKTIEEISPALTEPDPELFNSNAINPTVEVLIDGCEDVDKNGILSREELIKCKKIEDDTKVEEEQSKLVYCPDGTIVLDSLDKCPETENKQEVPAEEPEREPENGTTD